MVMHNVISAIGGRLSRYPREEQSALTFSVLKFCFEPLRSESTSTFNGTEFMNIFANEDKQAIAERVGMLFTPMTHSTSLKRAVKEHDVDGAKVQKGRCQEADRCAVGVAVLNA